MPSRGSLDIMAVLSTTVSPVLIRTAPLACSATVPVVIENFRPPTSNVFVTSATCEYTSTWEAWDRKAELEARASRPGFRGRAPQKRLGRGGSRPHSLPPDAQLGDERPIAPNVASHQVVQQPATLANQQQQTATRVMVLPVGLQVLREQLDALGEDGDLDLGRTRVGAVEAVLLCQPCLDFALDCQTGDELYRPTSSAAAATASCPSRGGRLWDGRLPLPCGGGGPSGPVGGSRSAAAPARRGGRESWPLLWRQVSKGLARACESFPRLPHGSRQTRRAAPEAPQASWTVGGFGRGAR